MRSALAFLISLRAVSAAVPGFESVYPAGGQAGSTVTVTVSGAGLEKGPVKPWISVPGVVITPADKPKLYTVTIPEAAPLGPCLMRFEHAEGSTAPRIFVIGKLPEQLESEPNNTPGTAKAQPLMNAVMNGVLERAGDVDTFAIPVKKGRLLHFLLHGYALGSPMDPALRLLDERGVELATAHDGHNLDPVLDHLPSADGTHFVQIMAFAHPPATDISLKGSSAHVYRLTVTATLPPAPEKNTPQALALPGTAHGTISQSAEEDSYLLNLEKGQEIQLKVIAAATGSLLDATLRLQDDSGKMLQQADDSGAEVLDPSLKFTPKTDGSYTAIIADRFQHGGPGYTYQIMAAPGAPEITATLDQHSYKLEAGKTTELKLKTTIVGKLASPLKLNAEHLPTGITAEAVEVPAKGGEAKLVLKADAKARPSQSPIQITLTTTAPDAEQKTSATYDIPFTERRGPLLIETDTQPWLTVTSPPPK